MAPDRRARTPRPAERALLALCFALAGACASRARLPDAPSSSCGRGPGFRYCVYEPPEGAPRDPSVHLYYLHGKGDGASFWGDWGAAHSTYGEFRRKGVGAPTVISVSYGPLWLLTEAPAGDGLRHFVSKAIPFIEGRLGVPRRRLLWGISMGGFNAAQLLTKHPSLWAAGVLSCPAIPTLPPQPTAPEVDSYVARTGAHRWRVEWMVARYGPLFRDPETWRRHDPVRLASEAKGTAPILVTCGDRDDYGFHEGSRRFAEALNAGDNRARFEAIPGGRHCAVEAPKVAAFLIEELQAVASRAPAR